MVRNFFRAFCVIFIVHTFVYYVHSYPSPEGLSTLVKRAVSWVNVKNPVAQSSNCSPRQKRVLNFRTTEIIDLARAGHAGFEIVEDMLRGPEFGTRFVDLTPEEQVRYRMTFITFFGVSGDEDRPTVLQMMGHVKDVLGRIKDSSVQTWPASIRFACDGSNYQETDREGKTAAQRISEGRLLPVRDPKKNKYYFDYDLMNPGTHTEGLWNEDVKGRACTGEKAGWTQNFNQHSLDDGDELDRITFCPKWFDIVDPHGPLKVPHIVEGKKLSDFARKGARLFLHEHLHTWPFQQVKYDEPGRLIDVEGFHSYGPAHVARIARTSGKVGSENQENENVPGWARSWQNIESIVYWCIAMYYGDWAWYTLEAAPLSADPPTDII